MLTRVNLCKLGLDMEGGGRGREGGRRNYQGEGNYQCHDNSYVFQSVVILIFCQYVTAVEDFDANIGVQRVFTPSSPMTICIDIPTIDDLVPENCAEMFVVTISSDDERVNVGNNMAVIQIDDDDGTWVYVSQYNIQLSHIYCFPFLYIEVEFCFIEDTPMVNGPNLTAIFELRGCATVICQTTTTDAVDCM